MKRALSFLVLLVCAVSCSLDNEDCDAPFQLSSEVKDQNSATLMWNQSILIPILTNYEIQYGLSGFNLGDGTFDISGNKRETIKGLIPNTRYDFYVRTLCREGDTSRWSGPVSFTTLE